ncbi:hypothetical protein PVAP13_4KG402601 [Panicum virgatum]|uniref:Uncharacterized protein n=1 Tax=Panicum virgatum TaxID=38727 RepID=A0A8T0TYB0_PANVG|nr:hypothetical protein PVAP13_4KG402601 [Panicum virgatum]
MIGALFSFFLNDWRTAELQARRRSHAANSLCLPSLIVIGSNGSHQKRSQLAKKKKKQSARVSRGAPGILDTLLPCRPLRRHGTPPASVAGAQGAIPRVAGRARAQEVKRGVALTA